MAVPVIMPKLEMSQETARIVEWLKKEGELVRQGEALLMVETDKVTVEVESPAAGVLSGLQHQAGEVVPVTSVIAYLVQEGEALPGLAKAQPEGVPGEKRAKVKATPLARRIAQANGIQLEQVDGSGPAGKVTRADLARLLESPLPAQQTKRLEAAGAARSPVSSPRATPAARRLARENGLEIGQISGSGPRRRVQAEDVAAFIEKQPPIIYPQEEIIPFSAMRQTIAERVLTSYQQAPHIYFNVRVDLTALESTRKAANQLAASQGDGRISLTALLVKITAWALSRHPRLNSRLQADGVHLLKVVNIGVAVALPEGLIVPVIQAADQKSLQGIANEVNDLARRAREGRLTLAEVAGGTFTISNLGPFGIESFTAILNPGQTGILAVEAAQPEAVVVGGRVEIRQVLHLTLGVDHRVVDGAAAAQFLATLKLALENPGLIMLSG